jgi:MFS family permease
MAHPAPHPAQLLRRGPFARYMAGETLSMLGTWMQQTAQGWVLAGLTSNAFTLGSVHFMAGLPMLVLTFWGGSLADRQDKRIILSVVVVAQACISVWLGWIIGSHHVAVWHLATGGILFGITTAFEVPAAAALVPELVEKQQIRHAMAVDRAVFHATRLAGPALGGGLIGLLGAASAFYANAISFLAILVALLSIPKTLPSPPPINQNRGEILAGLRHVRSDAPSASMLVLLSQITLFISPFFMVLMPLYSRSVLGIGPNQHGLLMGAAGGGAFLGALNLLRIPQTRRLAYLAVASTTIGLAMALLSQAQNLPTAVVSITLMTLGSSTVFGLANTIVQERAPDCVRGRVSALAGMSFFGILPFSGLAAARIADLISLRVAMLTGACCFTLGAFTVLLRLSGRLLSDGYSQTEHSRPKP